MEKEQTENPNTLDNNPNNIEEFPMDAEILEVEEIDKNALMDIDENDEFQPPKENNNKNNDNNNKDNKLEEDLENMEDYEEIDEQNEEEDDAVIESKEYPDFKAPGELYCIAVNQEKGDCIIGDGEENTIFYDMNKKTIIKTIKINKDSVNFLKFSPDNKYLLSSSIDGSINIFDVEKNYEIINTVNDQDAEINWIEWHPKGPCFAFGTFEGAVWVYMAKNTSNNFNFYSHLSSTTCGTFFKEGRFIVSGSEDCTSRIYNLKERKVSVIIKGVKYHQNPITCIAVAAHKNICATGGISNELGLINYDNGNILFFRGDKDSDVSIESIQFCNNDQYIVYADSNKKIIIFDMENLQIRSTINTECDNIIKMIVSNKNNYEIFASGTKGYVYILDTRGSGTIVQKDRAHKDSIMDFVVTKNEDFIISCSLDKTINLTKVITIN